jgi:AcrR family transcriptional regulator
MRAIAAEAGVGERTIYRYFANADECAAAVRAFVAPRLGVPVCDHVDELEDYAQRLFDTFEENHELTVAFLRSSWSAAELEQSRRANLEALTGLLRRFAPEVPDDEVRCAAASLRTVLSGSGWFHLRVSCGLQRQEVVANARWLIGAVLATLSRTPTGR